MTSAPAISSVSRRRAPRGARDDDGQRDLGRVAHELRVERQPRGGVEDDARAAGARRRRIARGEPRVVGERGADPDDDGVDLGAPVVRELAAAARRRSTASRRRAVATLPSRLIADLKSDPRAAGARVLAEGLVHEARARGLVAVGDDDLDALVAQDARGRGRWPSRSGRRWRRRRGRCRRRGSRRCRAAGGPGGSTARARRRSSRRAGRRRPRARRSRRPRRAAPP